MAVIFGNTPLRGSSVISRASWCLIKRQRSEKEAAVTSQNHVVLIWELEERSFLLNSEEDGKLKPQNVARGSCGSLCWPHGEGSVPMFLLVRISQGHCSFLTGDGPESLPTGWDRHWLRHFREGWSIFNINSFSSTFLLKIYEVLLRVDIMIKITDHL